MDTTAAQDKYKAVTNTAIGASSVFIIAVGLLHGWDYVEANGLNPFGQGGTASYRTDVTHQAAPIAGAVGMAVRDHAPVQAQVAAPVVVVQQVAPVAQAAPVQQAQPRQAQATVTRSAPVAHASQPKAVPAVQQERQAQPKQVVAAPKATHASTVSQQAPKAVSHAAPSMAVVTGLQVSQRHVVHTNKPAAQPKATTGNPPAGVAGSVPVRNKQIDLHVKAEVKPATKPTMHTEKQTIKGATETATPARTRQEAAWTESLMTSTSARHVAPVRAPAYSDDLMQPATKKAKPAPVAVTKPSAGATPAKQKLTRLKLKAAKEAHRLAVIRATKAKADKQAAADKRWAAYVEARREARQAEAAKRMQAKQAAADKAWAKHLETKRAARKAAKAKTKQVAMHKAEASKPAVKVAKVGKPAPKAVKVARVAKDKKPTRTTEHTEGSRKRDAVTVCIESPVTGKEICQ